MKLLYCIPALYNAGGMERVLTEKVNYLISLAGFEICIVTTDQNNKPLRFELDSRVKLIHLNIDFNSHLSYGLLKKYVLHHKKIDLYKTQLKEIIDIEKIDVCISLCGKEIEFLNNLDVKCKKIAEIHFAMNFRKQYLLARHKGWLWEVLGTIRTQQLKHSVKNLDKLVVLTSADKEQWELAVNNVIKIPNPNSLSNQSSAELNNKKVVSIGKLDPQKGYDMLIDAWYLLAKEYPDWELNIFGTGEQEDVLNEKIKNLDLLGKVNLRGTTTDVASQYLQSSLYVMSSRFEGLPLVLIEAISFGLPVVSFDCEYGPREIIKNDFNGFLVKPNDIITLAKKVKYLIENPEKRKMMGVNAKESSKKYEKEQIMKKWVLLLEGLKVDYTEK